MTEGGLEWMDRTDQLAYGQNLFDQPPFLGFISLAAVRASVDSAVLKALVTFVADSLRLREKVTMRQVRRKAGKLTKASGAEADPGRIGEEVRLITGELATDPSWFLYVTRRNKSIYNEDGSMKVSVTEEEFEAPLSYDSWRVASPQPDFRIAISRDGTQHIDRNQPTKSFT